MNKKSNIIVGVVAIAVVGLIVAGMAIIPKAGKGGEQPAAVQASQNSTLNTQKGLEVGVVERDTSSSPAREGSKGGSFVASKQGKKYFPVDCGSVKTIKDENRVYFGSEAEAQEAGYERTLTCK